MGKCTPLCQKCDRKGKVSDPKARCKHHEPALTVDPLRYVFPTTANNAKSQLKCFNIKNSGKGGYLRIQKIILQKGDTDQFEIYEDRASGQTLKPDEKKEIKVRFTPDSQGKKATDIVIHSNVGDSPTRVPIRGTTYKVIVVVSCDWDGHDLRNANIGHFEAFRNRYPSIPMTHFICASYFTGAGAAMGANPTTLLGIQQQMARAFRDGDEFGLHVHGWKTVIDQAQQDANDPNQWFINQHNWADLAASPGYTNCWNDIGHTNPLTLYGQDQIEQILRTSRTILNNNLPGGHQISSSFRSGGWVSNDDVKRAIVAAGFTIDSSAVPLGFAAPGSSLHTLHNTVPPMWQGITDESQPDVIDLGAHGKLKEVPNNFGLADYRTKAAMHNKMTTWALTRTEPTMVHIGFHQETVNGLTLYNFCTDPAHADGCTCTPQYTAADQAYLKRLYNQNSPPTGLLDDWHADNAIWPNLEFLTVEDAADLFLPSA
jgi:hypothetical protein